ncbi:MAG: hypothetical protein NVSMB16_03610 [Acidimicrobiales bacterium]
MTAIPSPTTPATGDIHKADAVQGQRIFRLPLWVAQRAGDVIQLAVAVLLLVIAGIVLYRTCADLLSSGADFPTRVTDAINGVLFVVIVLELIETVLSHFEGGGFQLQPFLVIGIISAVRHILTVGARLSLAGEGSSVAYSRAQVELGVNAGVVLALALALIMVRRFAGPSDD